jgi:hypothetical protein
MVANVVYTTQVKKNLDQDGKMLPPGPSQIELCKRGGNKGL